MAELNRGAALLATLSFATLFLMLIAVRDSSGGWRRGQDAQAEAGAGTVMALRAGVVASVGPLALPNALEDVLEWETEVQVRNEDYAQPQSIELYPWDAIMEPYKETTLTVMNLEGHQEDTISWSVRSADGSTEIASAIAGPSVSFTCDSAGEVLQVVVMATRKITGNSVAKTLNVACKYVRRELRQLTDEDRVAFFDNLAKHYRTDQSEGEALYGDKFLSSSALTNKFMSNTNGYPVGKCSPYRDSTSFFTSTSAFTYELERSLQLVDPSAAMHYWDMALDSESLGTDWWDSQIFSEDWFGVGSDDDHYVITTGPFAYTPVVKDDSKISQNPASLLTDPANMNLSPYVQRINSVCTVSSASVPLPSCSILNQAKYSASSLVEMDAFIESQYHARAHPLLGGMSECPYELAVMQERFPTLSTKLEQFAFSVGTVISTGMQEGIYSCPESCDDTVSQLSCLCVFSAFQAAVKDHGGVIQLPEMYTCPLLAKNSQTRQAILEAGNGLFHLEHNDDLDMDCLRVSGVESIASERIVTFVLGFVSFPGAQAPFFSSTTVTEDPLYAPLTTSYERLVHYVRLQRQTELDFSWSSDDTCLGRDFSDALPFSNFMGDTSGSLYTNEDLWTMFDPTSVELPYVFDTLDTACEADYEGSTTFSTSG